MAAGLSWPSFRNLKKSDWREEKVYRTRIEGGWIAAIKGWDESAKSP
jgi:hypothetical protein